ncbi:MAG: hypothetical protein JXR95_04195 [Deltaproteobacteria bacterium]|nr:hypothetical protein [Deltaproteobacteria bacterium]
MISLIEKLRVISKVFLVSTALLIFGCAKGGTGNSSCGNGVIEGTEQCDLTQMNGKSCLTEGFTGGVLECSSDCTLDVSGCTGECQDLCSPEGDTRCNGNYIETCSEAASGCLSWLSTSDCTDDGLLCDDSSGTPICTDSCIDACTQNERRCQGAVLQLCQKGENGCTQWKDEQDCSIVSWVCADSGAGYACLDPCDHECELGSSDQCSGTVVQQCATGVDGCRYWETAQDCDDSSRNCTSGSCQCVNDCSDGDTRCNGTFVEECVSDSWNCWHWAQVENCESSSMVCDSSSGTASCELSCTSSCSLGEKRCSTATAQDCTLQASGCYDWTDRENCTSSGKICTAGECLCENPCTAGEKDCNGDYTRECQTNTYGCTQWVNVTNCATLSQICTDGECMAVEAYTCDVAGSLYSSIIGTGTELTSDTYADDAVYSFTIPFAFNFYGVSYTSGYLCSNGWISFGNDPGVTTYTNTALPTTETPNAAIYVFWDDLVYSQDTWPDARLLYQVAGTSPNRVMTLEWYSLRVLGGGTEYKASFQVKLHETTNRFEVYYDRANWIGEDYSATVGYENSDGTEGGDIGSTLTTCPAEDYSCLPN